MRDKELFTIGHSNRSLDELMDLLVQHEISSVADVRSQPYSRYAPHFGRQTLEACLKARGMGYLFLGRELGARRCESSCYVDGIARYDLIETMPAFRSGLDRVRSEASIQRLALLCAEKDPLTCHRSILIARRLRDEYSIIHILSADKRELHEASEMRLLELLGLPQTNLFMDTRELIEHAYEQQAKAIAYVDAELVEAAGA